jgi:hypothetical protein
MKKSILTTTFLIAGAIGLLAQGVVSVDNNPYSFANSIESGGTENYLMLGYDGLPVVNSSWSVQLFEGTTARGARLNFYGDAFPGVWDAASDPFGGARSLGVAGGVQTSLSIAVYDGAGTEIARSNPFNYTPPTSPTPAPTDLLMANFRGFQVPEPSTVALGVLGLGALLLFRRRK